MAGKEPAQTIAIDSKALFEAIKAVGDRQLIMTEQFRSDIQKISATLDQLMGHLNNAKAPRQRAAASSGGSKAGSEAVQQAKAIKNPKLYFVDKYMKSEEERKKTASLVVEVHALTAYTKVDKDPKSTADSKLRKEAELIYDQLGKRDAMTEYLNSIKAEQKAALAAQQKALGHNKAAAASSSSVVAPVADAAAPVAPAAPVASTAAAAPAAPAAKGGKKKAPAAGKKPRAKAGNAAPALTEQAAAAGIEDEDEDDPVLP